MIASLQAELKDLYRVVKIPLMATVTGSMGTSNRLI